MAPLLPVTLAYMAGLLIAAAGCGWGMSMTCGVVGAALACHRRAPPHWRVVALCMMWMSLGCLRCNVWLAEPVMHPVIPAPATWQPVALQGTVVDDPVWLFGRHRFSAQRMTLDTRYVQTRAGWTLLNSRVSVMIEQPRRALQCGDRVLVQGDWSVLPAPTNPGQYDGRPAFARRRIIGRARIQPSDAVVIRSHGPRWAWWRAAIAFRHRCQQVLRAQYAPREAGLLAALLLGQRVDLEDRLSRAFIETGTMHLIVVSGSNVALIALLCELLLRLLGVSWRWRPFALAAGIGGYCVLTGLQPPVLRATLMAWVVLGAKILDRRFSWWNVLAVAALIMLWVNPLELFDPSAQLSFGAVASLLLLAAPWSDACLRGFSWIRWAWLQRAVAASVAATGAIWIGLSPLLAWYFHLITPISVVANLLVAPLIGLVVACGTPLLALGALAPAVLSWTGGLLRMLLQMTLACVWWCQAVPCGSWAVARPSVPWLAGYYGLLMLTVVREKLRLRAGHVAVCWLIGLNTWIYGGIMHQARESHWLEVDVLDVGHGDCQVIRTPRGQTLIVDAGTEEAGRFRLVPFLQAQGVSTVDALILTRADADHIGGALPLLETVRVRQIFTNGVEPDSMTANRVQRRAMAAHVPSRALSAGMALQVDPSVRIDVLHPPLLTLTKGGVRIFLPVSARLRERGAICIRTDGRALRASTFRAPPFSSER